MNEQILTVILAAIVIVGGVRLAPRPTTFVRRVCRGWISERAK